MTVSAPFPVPQSIDQFALTHDEEQAMSRLLQNLVQTPSTSGNEAGVAALIQKELHHLGIDNVGIDRAGSVVARIGTGAGPTILFDAHMDTVQVTNDWERDPYAAFISNGVLYGLGACDVKSSVAAMIYGAKRLIDSGASLNGELILAFTVHGEPCEGGALRVLLEHEGIQPDYVILGEPTNLQIIRGHRGRIMFEVNIHGKSSHASNPDLGKNAIIGAARLIFGIDLLAVDLPTDPFLGASTIAVTRIESQAPSKNTIPSTCKLYVDRRLTLGETASRAQAEMEQIVQREGVYAELEVVEYQATSYTGYEFALLEAYNAWALDRDHPLVQAASSALNAVTGQIPAVGHCSFSTDGVFTMAELNIPTLGFGPGKPEHAHTIDDQVRLADVAQAAQAYALLASMLLA